jgi:hypothetical protein
MNGGASATGWSAFQFLRGSCRFFDSIHLNFPSFITLLSRKLSVLLATDVVAKGQTSHIAVSPYRHNAA